MPVALAEDTALATRKPSVQSVVVTETFWRWKYGRIRVWETAPHPSGRTVILIHGYAAMIEHWRKNVAALAQDATVYALDLLGFGQSDMPDVMYGAKLWGEQIRDFMDARGVARTVIFGHSMGGLVAGQFAHDFPERTEALALVDPSGWPKRVPSDLMFQAVRFAATNPILRAASFFLFATPTMARQGLESAYYNQAAVTPELIELFSTPIKNRNAIHSYLAVARQPDDFHIDAPNGITPPTLIVWGGRDRLLPPTLMTPFRELIPHADIVVIPDTGHCPQDETPERFNACALEFLRSLP